jgi:hypothetical protein
MSEIAQPPVPTRPAEGAKRQGRVDQLITGFVDGILVPIISNGVLFIVFAVLWVAFGAAIIWSQGSLDATWDWVRSLPILVQAVVWLLFLPVVVGLWVWETTWPLVVRLPVLIGLAIWNLAMFLPRAAAAKP